MSEHINNSQRRQEILKQIIRELHDGANVDDVKARFQSLVQDVSPTEISRMEQTLIEEGLPESEVKRLCDVHVAVFRESLDAQDRPEAPAGHPVDRFRAENATVPPILEALTSAADAVRAAGSLNAAAEPLQQARAALGQLMELEKHYLRKENLLFPFLEHHGVSGPSSVMWAIHDDIRAAWKALGRALDEATDYNTLVQALDEQVDPLATMVRDMIYKEENILFPMSQEKLDAAEWLAIWEQGEEIGYAFGVAKTEEPPVPEPAAAPPEKETAPPAGRLPLNVGALSPAEIDLIFGHLPLDITFVDADDRVRYFSRGPERIFPRAPAIIGRQVQRCHPPASVHVVMHILDDFRAGRRDTAEFWIQMKGRFVHIRYFAVRDAEGVYQGTLEVSQDVTEIRSLTGERRILQDEAEVAHV